MAPPFLAAGDEKSFAREGARAVAREARRAVEARGACAIMLAGGGTPRAVYAQLARDRGADALPWDRITLYFGDERCVPPEDPESNYGMVQRTLLAHLPVAPASVHRMRGEDPDPERAAADYAALLPDRIDLLLLGVGEDGHTASLFPGSAALRERTRRVVPVRGPKPPPLRLTVTPPVIREARAVIVLAAGAKKAPIVARVLGSEPGGADLPIALAREALWILDRDAAAALPPAQGAATS